MILLSGGFFVECGSFDGEKDSNTLFFELERNWTGLLIEPTHKNFEILLKKRRKSFSINVCLNTENKTGKHMFDPMERAGGLVEEMRPSHREYFKKKFKALRHVNMVSVQCFTFYSIMKALGQTYVDLFSLDVEGAELGILKTIPLSKITINVLLVEYLVVGSKTSTEERFESLLKYINDTGLYHFVGSHHGLDMIFVRKNMIEEKRLKYWRSVLNSQK